MRDIPPSPRLEVRDLRVVLALASVGTTARAAQILHLTQPAVSRALLSVEDKLGAPLFRRTPRGLLPTPACERLLAGASRLLIELDDLEHRVRAPTPLPERVRLVCECYTAYHWLPSALVTLRRALPGLEVALAVEHTHAPYEALEAGKIDIALTTSAQAIGAGIEERALFSDELLFVVSADHPLAARKTLSRADLRTNTILTSTLGRDDGRWFMTRVFGRARPKLRFEKLPLTEAILDMARAGMGIAVASEWITGPHLGKGDLVAKRLTSGPLYRQWKVVWRSEVRDAALRLLSALEASAPRPICRP